MTAELAIRGGTLVDGTGAAPVRGDIGIAGGRVVEIGAGVRGDREIDATGRIVAPGFIDIHTHYDPQVLWDPWLTPSCWLGVTSVVAGNCGYSLAPTRPEGRGTLVRTLDKVEDMRVETLEAGVRWDFETYPEYLAAVAGPGVALNFGGFVGHTAVRLYILGDEAYEREATAEEIAAMRAVVAGAITGGALGFSSNRSRGHVGDGGRPVPSAVASQAELEQLMAVPSDLGRGMVHLAPGNDVAWLYDLQPKLGRPITWSSLLSFREAPGARHPFRDKVDAHREGWAAGVHGVRPQVSCRPITIELSAAEPTPLYRVPAFAELAARPRSERVTLYADHTWRARASEEVTSGRFVDARLDNFAVAESRTRPAWAGRRISELAAEVGRPVFDLLCDLAVADDLDVRFRVTFANDDVATVTELIRTEGCVLGLSDAGAHVSQIFDAVMAADFLATWVRDREIMSIEAGIHKLTGELADVVGLDRGRLEVGAPADVVVLDLERLSPGPARRVHDLPGGGERLLADAPTGIDHVLVNGTPIRTEGESALEQLRRLPGQLLVPH